MLIVRHPERVPAQARGAVVALGNFDGLHRGHRVVTGEAKAIAQRLGAPWGVVTFEPHPRQFFQPTSVPFRLTPFRAKARLVGEQGADVLAALRFGPALAGMLAQDFVAQVLVKGLGVRHVVTGPEFVFGKGRRGNAYVLAHMAAMEGFGYTQVPAFSFAGETCSATEVRVLLRRGLVAEAALRLGRWWEFEGRVVHGRKLGRDLGYPTANLPVAGRLHPDPGIYAVRAGLASPGGVHWHDAVASLGTRPTVDGKGLLLEVNLFDFAGDLYGRRLCVAFVERIRKELRFPGLDALKVQMAEDCANARRILANAAARAAFAR
jgi:riboflavin kinase / FMN adenylyltransferase